MRLPRTLRLKVEGCDGESNAWYEDDAITVCYEYIDDILRNAPQETTPAGVTRADAIVGPTLEVFLHEGHPDYLTSQDRHAEIIKHGVADLMEEHFTSGRQWHPLV